MKTDDEAIDEFKLHMQSLIEDMERKTKADTKNIDHTIFEAPVLVDYRRQDIIKNNLLNRRRVVIKGFPCPRCHKDEIYQEEVFSRAGDEGGVQHNVCSKCNYAWHY
jgi:DNA-directed RNA polymerase subunit M/transcription elongation factor TFIIS